MQAEDQELLPSGHGLKAGKARVDKTTAELIVSQHTMCLGTECISPRRHSASPGSESLVILVRKTLSKDHYHMPRNASARFVPRTEHILPHKLAVQKPTWQRKKMVCISLLKRVILSAGAMLIFSVSFQIDRMGSRSPRREKRKGDGGSSCIYIRGQWPVQGGNASTSRLQ